MLHAPWFSPDRRSRPPRPRVSWSATATCARIRVERRTAIRPVISLVIPAHEEEDRIAETLRRYRAALAERYGDTVEIIVVANACSDGTAEAAEHLGAELPGLRVLDIPDRIGKGGAVLEGFRNARGRICLFADADGATDPESLLGLIDGLAEADVVIGSRQTPESVIERPQPLRRRILSRCFNLVVRTLFGIPFRDTQCGAKAFRAAAAKQLAEIVEERGWTFDLDLLLGARRLGLTVVERPVRWTDVDGSRLDAGSAASSIAASLLRLRWRELRGWESGRSARPASPAAPPIHAAETTRRRPQRILALNWRDPRHPEAGGAEQNLFEQARRWTRAGHAVTVVAARDAGDRTLPDREMIDGVEVRRMGGRFGVYLQAAWYVLTRSHRYDRILDVANGIPFFAPLFTDRPTTLLVHHVHDRQWFAEFSRPLAAVGWFLERWIVPLVYRDRPTIAVSPTTRDALVSTGFSPDRIRIVYNGVTAAAADDAQRDRGTILYVGRVKRYKRLDRLVRAYAELRPRFTQARLIIAGDGDARPELERLASELGVADGVRFLGHVDEPTKARLLAGARMFATPSMHEGWGLSVVEANHHGTPAVAYEVPGLSAAIRQGETGLLARDDDAFREAIARLLDDDELHAKLSAGAREWARRFDWDTAARETLEVLGPTPETPASTRRGERHLTRVA